MAGGRTVIMLSGYMQSGKDTVGAILQESFGFKRFAFADSLKDEVSQEYNISRESLDTPGGKAAMHATGCTVRSLLIRHGETMRKENPNHWVERVVAAIRKAENGGSVILDRIVITDWRFPGEWHALTRMLQARIFTWRISRWSRPPLKDSTELALDDFPFDAVLRNNWPTDNLFEVVCARMYALRDRVVRILLTDVDEVLLDWISAFRAWVVEHGYTVQGERPIDRNIAGWVVPSSGVPLKESEALRLVEVFNESDSFEHILPRAHSQEVLPLFKRAGYHIVAVSSCTNNLDARAKRERCLQRRFNNCVDKVICLPLGASKKEVLRAFPPAIWIDDDIRNVQDGAEVGHRAYLMLPEAPSAPVDLLDCEGVLHGWLDAKQLIEQGESFNAGGTRA